MKLNFTSPVFNAESEIPNSYEKEHYGITRK